MLIYIYVYITTRFLFFVADFVVYLIIIASGLSLRHGILDVIFFYYNCEIDEIPQIINILRRNISIVGPRPLYYDEHNFLNKYVPNHSVRSIVKPGLTGWAQLNFKAPPTYCLQNIDLGNKLTDDILMRLSISSLMMSGILKTDLWYLI